MRLPDRLQTDRLVIRPFQESDRAGFVRFMTTPAVTKYLAFTEEHKTAEGANAMLDWVIQSYSSNNPVLALGIADKNTDEFLGSCGLSPLEEAGEVECYYSLLPEHWKKGFAVEAMRVLLHYAFSVMDIVTLVALMHPKNKAAHSLATRIGLQETGVILHPLLKVKTVRFALDNPNRGAEDRSNAS